jgi:hypothetical protein
MIQEDASEAGIEGVPLFFATLFGIFLQLDPFCGPSLEYHVISIFLSKRQWGAIAIGKFSRIWKAKVFGKVSNPESFQEFGILTC